MNNTHTAEELSLHATKLQSIYNSCTKDTHFLGQSVEVLLRNLDTLVFSLIEKERIALSQDNWDEVGYLNEEMSEMISLVKAELVMVGGVIKNKVNNC